MRLGKNKYSKSEAKSVDDKIKYKISLFLICVFIATFFWFIIKLSAEYTTIVYYPIKFSNLPQDKIILSTPDSVLRLLVKAKGFKIMNTESLKETSIIDLDISNLQTYRSGKYFYASMPSSRLTNQISAQIGQGVNLISITPDTLSFIFESIVEKVLPVVFNGEISFEKGYFLYDSIVIRPSQVKLTGPQHIIDSLSEIKTERKKITGVNSLRELEMKLELPKETRFSDLALSSVNVILPVEAYEEVALEFFVQFGLEEKKPQFRLNPSSVKVIFDVAQKDISNFAPQSFIFYIDPNEYIADSVTRLKVKHSGIPNHIKIGSISPDEIEIQPIK